MTQRRRISGPFIALLLMAACSAPTTAAEPGPGVIWVDGYPAASLQAAFDEVGSGGLVQLGAGEYRQAGVLRPSNVTVRGVKGAVLRGVAADGKAALVIRGDNTVIETLECRDIRVRDGNGACVRLEGVGLTLRGVHFHDSQEGLLAGGKDHRRVLIEDSRFERLGHGGQAHAIYVNNSELVIRRSEILSSKGQGHEVKSGGYVTLIEDSVIASMDGVDSRLIDVTQGGRLTIRRSVLEEGRASANSDMIGYALEGFRFPDAEITIEDCIVISDTTDRHARFLNIRHYEGEPKIANNLFVGPIAEFKQGIVGRAAAFFGLTQRDPANRIEPSRSAAGLPPYPELPALPTARWLK
jgi:hypothetical protein